MRMAIQFAQLTLDMVGKIGTNQVPEAEPDIQM